MANKVVADKVLEAHGVVFVQQCVVVWDDVGQYEKLESIHQVFFVLFHSYHVAEIMEQQHVSFWFLFGEKVQMSQVLCICWIEGSLIAWKEELVRVITVIRVVVGIRYSLLLLIAVVLAYYVVFFVGYGLVIAGI